MARPQPESDLLDVLAALDDPSEISKLLMDLLTYNEVESVNERWAIVKLLAAGHSQRAIRDELGASVTTISRGNKQIKYGEDGFAIAFETLGRLGHGDPRLGGEK